MHPCKAVARRVQEPAKGMLHSTLGDKGRYAVGSCPRLGLLGRVQEVAFR